MRKLRENLPNRVYHLISRVAHRAFFLNAEELAAREAEEEGLTPKSVPTLRRERKDALGIASRSYFTLKYLSPLVAGGYIAPVDKDSPSSSRCAYKLTRKGKEAAQW